MSLDTSRGPCAAGTALLLVLLLGAALVPAAAAFAAAATPDAIHTAVLAYPAGGDAVLSTSLVERVRNGDPVETLGVAGPGSRTLVYVQLDPGTPTAVLDPLLSGIVDREESRGLVTARVTVDELAVLAGLDGVRTVREVDRPVVASGTAMTAGDAVVRGDAVRALGLSGGGVKVGVISDGVEGSEAARASGDLGAVMVLGDDEGGQEGTAMLEIIHDIAPGAELYFHDHGDSVLGFNRAVDDLVAAGCRVIVDDVAWPREPFFEDGVIAEHLTSLIATHQLVYVTATGNYARQHFQGPFVDDGEGFQDFSRTGSDRQFLYADVPAGEQLKVVLQWDEPFGSAGDDFDLFLCDATEGTVLRASTSLQSGSSDPMESLSWTNPGPRRQVAIVALHRGGNGDARTLEVYAYPSTGAEVSGQNLVAGDGIYGHQAVPDVIAVGAVSATNPGTIEPFSSNGPVTHLFPTPRVIRKPDVVAPDRVAVSGAGGFKTVFVGTSASSPHVGAVCALVWSGHPGLSAAEIRSALLGSAVDLGTVGQDDVHGWGRVDAAAMNSRLTSATPVPTPPPVPPVVTSAPTTPAPVATPTPAAIATRSPFGKRYAIGDLAGRTVGARPTLAPGSGSTTRGSPTVGPTIDPLVPPGARFVRWYPSARWAAGR